MDFQNKRLGKYSDDDSITSITEFTVQKHQPRHSVKGYTRATVAFPALFHGPVLFVPVCLYVAGPGPEDICSLRDVYSGERSGNIRCGFYSSSLQCEQHLFSYTFSSSSIFHFACICVPLFLSLGERSEPHTGVFNRDFA